MARHLTRAAVAGMAAVAGIIVLASLTAQAAGESIGALRDRIAETEEKKLELVKTLALIFEARGNQEQATVYTREAFLLDPADEVLADRLLDLLRKQEQWAEMVPVYERLIDERPGRSQQYLLELGTCHFKIGQPERAIEVLEQYRKEYANAEETYLKLAEMLRDNGRLAEAVVIVTEAATGKFEASYKIHRQLGMLHVEMGETEQAIDAYEAALDRVEPGSDRNAIHSRLISLYKKTDRIDEVIAKRERELDAIDAQLITLYWAEAEKREKAEDFAQAVALYRKIAALAPESDKGTAAAAKAATLALELEPGR